MCVGVVRRSLLALWRTKRGKGGRGGEGEEKKVEVKEDEEKRRRIDGKNGWKLRCGWWWITFSYKVWCNWAINV